MSPITFPRLHELDGVVRLFLTAFLVTISLGYFAGVYFVSHTTSVTSRGTIEQFRGNEDSVSADRMEIKFEKSTLEMLSLIHSHVTSFSMIYLAVGGIFLFSSFSRRLRIILTIEPFLATILLFGGMAGLRYLGGSAATALAWLMMVAGFSTFLCFAAMVGLSIREMWSMRAPAPER
jgi:hypothetical protein